MTADPLEKIREGLLNGVADEPKRSKRRRTVASLVAITALFAGGLALASPWGERSDDAVIAGEGTESGETTDSDGTAMWSSPSTWSIEEPSSWHRAGRELMPNLGWDSLTIATISLQHGGERCAQVPEQALRDLGDDDALISIFFNVPSPASDGPWPSDVAGLPVLDNSDPAECADRSDLEVRWAHVERADVAFYVLVALGPNVHESVRREASAVLRSFRPVGGLSTAQSPRCVVTLPPADQPVLPVPVGGDLDGVVGEGQSWLGTPGLWTALPDSGIHLPRKSIWWSQHFPGGSVEPRPPLSVAWQRLDAEAPPIVAEAPGTNGPSPDSGFFMLNGIDPDEPGCWKVTAEYKGHELSYVYWNPAMTTSTRPDGPDCTVDGDTTVDVPDMTGLPLEEAVDRAEAVGLLVIGDGVPAGDPTTADALVTAQAPPPGSAVPGGSCIGFRTEIPAAPLPQPGEPLTDGRLAVFITDVSTEDRALTVDVIEWLEGQAADDAYAADTGDTSGAPNDYYIRNATAEPRTLPLDTATATVAFTGTGPLSHEIRLEELPEYLAERNNATAPAPFWITVSNGAVVELSEQYTP